MNRYLKRTWVRRANLYAASVTWLCVMPFAFVLLALLYPFDQIHEWAESAWEEMIEGKDNL